MLEDVVVLHDERERNLSMVVRQKQGAVRIKVVRVHRRRVAEQPVGHGNVAAGGEAGARNGDGHGGVRPIALGHKVLRGVEGQHARIAIVHHVHTGHAVSRGHHLLGIAVIFLRRRHQRLAPVKDVGHVDEKQLQVVQVKVIEDRNIEECHSLVVLERHRALFREIVHPSDRDAIVAVHTVGADALAAHHRLRRRIVQRYFLARPGSARHRQLHRRVLPVPLLRVVSCRGEGEGAGVTVVEDSDVGLPRPSLDLDAANHVGRAVLLVERNEQLLVRVLEDDVVDDRDAQGVVREPFPERHQLRGLVERKIFPLHRRAFRVHVEIRTDVAIHTPRTRDGEYDHRRVLLADYV